MLFLEAITHCYFTYMALNINKEKNLWFTIHPNTRVHLSSSLSIMRCTCYHSYFYSTASSGQECDNISDIRYYWHNLQVFITYWRFAEAYGSATYGTGSGSILMDDLSCSGSEKDIGDCTFSGWTKNNCGHTEDVGVSCGLYQTVYTV